MQHQPLPRQLCHEGMERLGQMLQDLRRWNTAPYTRHQVRRQIEPCFFFFGGGVSSAEFRHASKWQTCLNQGLPTFQCLIVRTKMSTLLTQMSTCGRRIDKTFPTALGARPCRCLHARQCACVYIHVDSHPHRTQSMYGGKACLSTSESRSKICIGNAWNAATHARVMCMC